MLSYTFLKNCVGGRVAIMSLRSPDGQWQRGNVKPEIVCYISMVKKRKKEMVEGSVTLFRMGRLKTSPTNFSPVPSTNVGISPPHKISRSYLVPVSNY